LFDEVITEEVRVCNSRALINVDLKPKVPIDCAPVDPLIRVFGIVSVDFGEEFVEIMLDHFVKSKRVWVSFLPSVNVDGENHHNCRCEQNRCQVIDSHRTIHSTARQQNNPKKSNERRQTDVENHFLGSLLAINDLLL